MICSYFVIEYFGCFDKNFGSTWSFTVTLINLLNLAIEESPGVCWSVFLFPSYIGSAPSKELHIKTLQNEEHFDLILSAQPQLYFSSCVPDRKTQFPDSSKAPHISLWFYKSSASIFSCSLSLSLSKVQSSSATR